MPSLQLADARKPAGEDPPDQRGRVDSCRQPVLQPGERRQSLRFGRWGYAIRSRLPFSRFSGTLHINDVGQNTWEEINLGVAGANYGWPATEGPTSNPAYRSSVVCVHACIFFRLRDRRRGLSQHVDRALSVALLGRVFLRGFVRRVDTRTPLERRGLGVGDGNIAARGPGVRKRRQLVLSRPRRRLHDWRRVPHLV